MISRSRSNVSGVGPLDYACITLAALLASSSLAHAAVNGVVVNATTGKPASGAAVVLISFAEGMDPIEEVFSGADGSFEFTKELVSSGPQPLAGLIRAEFDGIAYSTTVMKGATEGIEALVYQSSAKRIDPTGRILLLHPGANEMLINESYLFENNTDPQVTYSDPDNGSLRFYLPPEAKGIVKVEGQGPARMPLNSSAVESNEKDIYMVDFPVKPGNNQVSLTYLIPYAGEGELLLKTPYKNLQTRVAIPDGVVVTSDDAENLGQEPRTGANIYEVPGGPGARIAITGTGAMRGSEGVQASDPGEANQIKIAPAPITEELPWLLILACAILVIGFYNLYSSKKRADG